MRLRNPHGGRATHSVRAASSRDAHLNRNFSPRTLISPADTNQSQSPQAKTKKSSLSLVTPAARTECDALPLRLGTFHNRSADIPVRKNLERNRRNGIFNYAPRAAEAFADRNVRAPISANPQPASKNLSESLVTPAARWGQRALPNSAFTLIEVLLAISITLGMFVIVLYFYHQVSNTRNAILTEVEKVTAARMIMGQITSELRSAVVDSKGGVSLRGTSSSIKIATLGLPPAVLNLSASNNPSTLFQTGLKLVSYTSLGVPEMPEDPATTNTPIEEVPSPFGELLPEKALPSNVTNSLSLNEPAPGGIQRSEEPIMLSSFLSADTAANAGTNISANIIPVATTLLTEHFRFINFRYFNGSSFQNSWNLNTLPMAVEITLSNELPAGSEISSPPIFAQSQVGESAQSQPAQSPQTQETPRDFYRRLVYLSSGEPSSSTNRIDTLFREDFAW